MSRANVEIALRLAEFTQKGFRTGDLDSAMDEAIGAGLISADCEWRAGPRRGAAVVGVGDEVGRAGILEFMRSWTEDFSDFALEVEEVFDADEDGVVVIQRQTGTGKASGAPVEIRTAAILRFESGRVVRIDIFLDPAKALEAAGLRGVDA